MLIGGGHIGAHAKKCRAEKESTVSVRGDLNECRVDHEPGEMIGVTPAKADKPGPSFIVPWRLNANAARPRGEDLGDASCGCGPVD